MSDAGTELPPWFQQTYVKASNTWGGNSFGSSVALSSDGATLAVAAELEDSNATGVNGAQGHNDDYGSGAVYVFRLTGTSWVQEAYLKASNTKPESLFGHSVALSADGTTLVVGAERESGNANGFDDNTAYKSGAVYVFRRTGTTWAQEAYLKASNMEAHDGFGSSVAVSAHGDTLAVGAPGEDSAATGVNRSQGDNSASKSGAVYVFRRTRTTWAQEAYLKASNTGADDSFGWCVAINADGNTLAVGAAWEDSNAIGVNGTEADDSAGGSGAVYVFRRGDNAWGQEAYLKASNTSAGDGLGWSVAVSADGSTLALGARAQASAGTGVNTSQRDNSAPNSGAVYVFVRSGSSWIQEAYLKASNTGAGDGFGSSVALSADGATLAVGAGGESSNAIGVNSTQDDNSAQHSGAVYIFGRTSTAWAQKGYVKASNTEAGDGFGYAVALSAAGATLAVGATGEDGNATGVNGNQADNSSPFSGAVYVFAR